MKLSIGDIVHVVYPSLRIGTPARRSDMRVAKVGRVWATLENGERFELANGRLDGKGYASPGMVWESADEYLRAKTLKWAWGALLDQIGSFRHHPPPFVTFNQLRKIAIELGVPLPEPPAF